MLKIGIALSHSKSLFIVIGFGIFGIMITKTRGCESLKKSTYTYVNDVFRIKQMILQSLAYGYISQGKKKVNHFYYFFNKSHIEYV